MGGDNNRKVAELTDDEIVDMIATFGRHGMHVTDCCAAVKRAKCEPSKDECSLICKRAARIYFDTNRLVSPEGNGRYYLAPREWAKRLVGKTVEELEKLLEGSP